MQELDRIIGLGGGLHVGTPLHLVVPCAASLVQ